MSAVKMKAVKTFFVAGIGLAGVFSMGCGGGSSSPKANVIAKSGQNVTPIVVNAGPTNNYVNGAFASVTLCVPQTSTCQTIDNMLVDTGSSGLRIVSSVLTLALPQQKAPSGNPVAECLPFLGSYTWGPVQTADVQIAGENAAAAPIQVLSDTDTNFTVPSACSNGLPSADTVANLGANGILGVGAGAQDCGSYCEQVQTANFNLYYECSSSAGCQPVAESLAQQVINPVSLFSSDNNGVIIELPAVSGSAASLNGSLVFGIGTQANNALGTATVYTIDSTFSFTTSYKGTPYSGSFIDSGSNGYFVLDSTTVPALVDCPQSSNAPGFYCPATTQTLSATNQGLNGATGTVNFSIANAETLFSNPTDTVFSQLGGPSIIPPAPGGTSTPPYFDWGLPFFYGRNVYTAIENASTPGGKGPYWAY
jgi:predicted aspartyl protease